MSRSVRIGRLAATGGLLGAVLLLSVVVVSRADAQDSRTAQERACSHDVSRHCRRYLNEGDMAIYQCLQNNRERLSPACRRLVDGH